MTISIRVTLRRTDEHFTDIVVVVVVDKRQHQGQYGGDVCNHASCCQCGDLLFTPNNPNNRKNQDGGAGTNLPVLANSDLI